MRFSAEINKYNIVKQTQRHRCYTIVFRALSVVLRENRNSIFIYFLVEIFAIFGMRAVKTVLRDFLGGGGPSSGLMRWRAAFSGAANVCCSAENDYEVGQCPADRRPLRVTVIEGQGTGPAVCEAVRKVFKAACVPVEWDRQTLRLHRDLKTDRTTVSPEVLRSATETGLVLRAQDSAVTQNDLLWSGTLTLNKALNAFVGVRKFKSAAGYEPYGPVNLINVRDNVSGEYSEIEHTVVPGNNSSKRSLVIK